MYIKAELSLDTDLRPGSRQTDMDYIKRTLCITSAKEIEKKIEVIDGGVKKSFEPYEHHRHNYRVQFVMLTEQQLGIIAEACKTIRHQHLDAEAVNKAVDIIRDELLKQ